MDFKQFEQALLVPGRILVFLDDSELSGVFEGPVDLYGGVVLRSDDYANVEATLAGILSGYPKAKELHAVEVMNPSKAAEGWTNYSMEQRRDVFARWGACLSSAHLTIPYLYLRRDQWQELLEQGHAQQGQVDILKGKQRKPEEAVRRVALDLLARFIHANYGEQVAIFVQDAKANQVQESRFIGHENVFECSLFHAFSHLVAGLQLADLAIYSISRCTRLIQQQKVETSPPLQPLGQELLRTFARLNVVPLTTELSKQGSE